MRQEGERKYRGKEGSETGERSSIPGQVGVDRTCREGTEGRQINVTGCLG